MSLAVVVVIALGLVAWLGTINWLTLTLFLLMAVSSLVIQRAGLRRGLTELKRPTYAGTVFGFSGAIFMVARMFPNFVTGMWPLAIAIAAIVIFLVVTIMILLVELTKSRSKSPTDPNLESDSVNR